MKKKRKQDHIVTATIQTVDEVDYLLMTELHIWFVLSGYLEIVRNGSNILMRTGDIFVLNKGDLVRVVNSEENATLKVAFVSNEYQVELPPFQLNIPLAMVYKKEGYAHIKNCMASLYVEMSYPADGSDYMIEGYAKRLIGLLLRYLQTVDEKEQIHAASDKIQEVVSYINMNYAEKLSLDEIADKFYSSKFYLAHSFKNQLGITIGNYIKEVRLFHSYRMLESTTEKIVTIALSNGFPNVRAFNEAFKLSYKLTPAEFREERKRGAAKKRTDSPLSQDVMALLAPYMPPGEIVAQVPMNPDRIEAQIDMQVTISRYAKGNDVLKVKGDLRDSRLLEVRQRLGVKWVAVNRIVKIMDVKVQEGKLVCSFRELDRILQQIISAGMLPYLQIQFIDYDDWQEMGYPDKGSFQAVFKELHHHLQQNYYTSNDWMYEFRCFYEFTDGGELCLPVVEAISIFEDYKNIVIHFPVLPEGAVTLDSDCLNAIYCIDDMTYMRKISLEDARSHLFDQAYIQIISENKNMKVLSHALTRMLAFEKDDYLQTYSDLAQANASIWQYMSLTNQFESMNHFYTPLSLDSAKLFEYFPDELASKLSLCTPDGRYKDNWYAKEFVMRLFEEVVYRNDACIVTKRGDNYRILAVYPEEELILFMNQKSKEESEIAWKKAKSPYIHIKLDMQNLEGTYRLIQQELTPELVDQRSDISDLRKCKKLSLDDIAYWNGVNRPARRIETLTIKESHTLEFEVPIFGIIMIDLEKTNI
ncbi:AraC family transcriptional regulator [Paenibacillus sp. N1-5-1-14]|uniref:helix-turn-helix transcriptional regulator n=1 Tax=Paenibacillus radicibacter TaxID=2972488 RepID=UPI0021599743|nr:AraC family transcriptional regulator [Paenibacillus radicibacter]MCR8644276.1 AraC family transcriptional regulator [Paenibacillus radicibacter]